MVEFNVRLKDYSMLYVDCEAGFAAELSDYFSFYVPGYKFMPMYKNKVWDGKVKLFNRMTGELNAGLYVYLLKFASERSYSVDTEESDQYGLPVPQQLRPEHMEDLLKGASLPFQPRDSSNFIISYRIWKVIYDLPYYGVFSKIPNYRNYSL